MLVWVDDLLMLTNVYHQGLIALDIIDHTIFCAKSMETFMADKP